MKIMQQEVNLSKNKLLFETFSVLETICTLLLHKQEVYNT
jgi:hypothetical protein